MTTYVGKVGSLIPLGCATSLRVGDARSMSLSSALGGHRIAYLGAASKRVWDSSIDIADSGEVSLLQVLVRSLPMPWVWLSPWACSTNTITPEHSLWQGLTLAGASVGSLVPLEGGGYAPSLNDPAPPGGTRFMTSHHPVVPGVPVTAGVFARPSGTDAVSLRISWRDAAGDLILPTVSAQKVCAGSGPMTRVTVTATPPANAVDCYLNATNHSVLAGPTLTFSSQPHGWAIGAGCMTAVVPGVELGVISAWAEPDGQRASYDFTVTEVG